MVRSLSINKFYIFNFMWRSYKYPLKIWLTGVLCGPLFCIILSYGSLNFAGIGEALVFYGILVIFGGPMSLPCFIILWLFNNMIAKTSLYKRAIKHLSAVLCIILCFALFSLINYSRSDFWDKHDSIFTLSYAIPLVMGCYFYKLSISTAESDLKDTTD